MPNAKSAAKPEDPMVVPIDPKARLHPITIEKLRESGFKVKRGAAKQNKVPITIRLDPDIVEALRSMGAGWQPKTNDLLRKRLKL